MAEVTLRRRLWASLRVRALGVVLVVAAAPLILVAVAGVRESQRRQVILQRLEAATLDAEGMLEPELGLQHPDTREGLASVARAHAVWLRVFDARGELRFEHEGQPRPPDPLFLDPSKPGSPRDFDARRGPLLERPELSVARRAGRADGCLGSADDRLNSCFVVRHRRFGEAPPLILYVSQSSFRSVRALVDLRWSLVKVTLVILPGALLLAWWLGWRMVRPIEKLRAGVLDRAHQPAPRAPLPDARPDELGDLARAFNHLMGRLEDEEQRKLAFVQDLTHELKNPVAAIRASAEHMGDAPIDAERARRLADVLQQSSRRLDALLTDLLELAAAEGGMPGEVREGVDLAALCAGVLGGLRVDERFEGIEMSYAGPKGCRIRGVPGRLEAAVRNLMDNAIAFAAAGDGPPKVQLTLRPGPTAVELEVQDNGPGIADEDLPRVFDRFFSQRREGTGLGLALVRAVAIAHGGRVEAGHRAGGGACFVMTLPAS